MRHVTANLRHNRGTKSGEARSIGCLMTQKNWGGTCLSASVVLPQAYENHFIVLVNSELVC